MGRCLRVLVLCTYTVGEGQRRICEPTLPYRREKRGQTVSLLLYICGAVEVGGLVRVVVLGELTSKTLGGGVEAETGRCLTCAPPPVHNECLVRLQ